MSPWPWDGVVEVRNAVPVVRDAGAPVSAVVDRLGSGANPGAVCREFGVTPAGLVAVLAFDALGDGRDEPGPPLLQGAPRRPALESSLSESSLSELFPESSRIARLALSAGLLQVHDFWEASHHAAQEADDLGERSVSAYWHGIAHRREPDAGNAAYWFRRVGRHPLFVPLASAVRPRVVAAGNDPTLVDWLLPGGSWDPLAFIHFCQSARAGNAAIARDVQRVEMALLLQASTPRLMSHDQ